MLARVLLKNHWQVQPEFLIEGDADALVLIGDRTFGKTEQYEYSYDLAGEWRNYTGLPFAFAVWASNKPIADSFLTAFDSAMKWGLDHRMEVIASIPAIENFNIEDYLINKVDFDFDYKKREALDRFHQLIKKLGD